MYKIILVILSLSIFYTKAIATEMCITMPKASSYPFSERVYNLNREPTKWEIMVLERLDGVDAVFAHHGRYAFEVRKGLLFHWMNIEENMKELFDADRIDFCNGFTEGVYYYDRSDGYATWRIE